MKINVNTRIVSKSIVLVPYREKHVPRYHLWMKSPELQHLTGSEPLTLQEEYDMQKSWREDENKCTFIVLDRQILLTTGQEIESMIGDTNLYFNNTEEPCTAECEIMIAEESARGRKMGMRAMILMFRYGIDFLKVNKYVAKIKLDNDRSLGMFTKLGFNEVSKSAVFHESTMEKQVDDEWIKWLKEETPEYEIDDNWHEDSTEKCVNEIS
ncbi:N-acetyltransferase 9-like protein [Venturia canescens]|uniref:N-acetyltransferase 9-like protein n=1 Tax=Venturia canescens TaxID=32260 RepID=UPI001C9C65D7|nr:N-acetyltransferase 9-like protein [Venturia canescens]